MADEPDKVDQPQAPEEAVVEEAPAAEEKPGTAGEARGPKPRTRKKAEPKAEAQPKAQAKAESKAKAESDAEAEAEAEETEEATEAKPARKRGSRGGRGRTKEPEAASQPSAEKAPPKEEPKPRRVAERVNGAGPVVRAQARYVRTSARKARMVCDHIRGKSVDEARAILAFTPRAVARDWSKVLESAVANAEHNHELVGDDLRVLAAFADEGPTLKRFRPRAMGRATRIRKRTSHLTITLTPKES